MAIAYLGENQIGGGGGDENVIESISVNNVEQTVSDKNVNITVPTKVSQLTNDSGFTANTGTITGVKMNGSTVASSGVADLGTVITSHATRRLTATNGTATSTSGTITYVESLTGTTTATSGDLSITATRKSVVIPSAPGTLNTTATAAQSTSSSEALSGNVTLHKVSKTGTYSDLIGTPNIPLAVYFDPSNQNLYFFKSTADRDSFVANKTQTSLIMFSACTAPYIRFKDSKVLTVLLANNIGDGTGVTETQAASANIGTIFQGNTEITSFNELQYFYSTSISENAFNGCTALTEITLPNITTMGNNSFYGCSSLRSITIPSTVTRMGSNSFRRCTNLKSVIILGNVNRTDSTVFADCSSLREFHYLGISGLHGANSMWFSGCTSLTELYFKDFAQSMRLLPNATAFYTQSMPFTANSDTHYVYFDDEEVKNLVIPDTVTSIVAGACYRWNRVESVTIPSTVTSIGNQAFYDMSSLKNFYNHSTYGDVANYLNWASGNQTGTMYTAGSTTVGLSPAFSGFKHIIIAGNVTQLGNQQFVKNNPVESIRIGGNYDVTANSYGITRHNQAPNLKFVEFGNTVFGVKACAYDFTPQNDFIFHLSKTDGIAFNSSSFTDANAMRYLLSPTHVIKIYVGDGSSAAADQAVLAMYQNDASWADYSSKLDIWYNYNGEYKTYTL